MVLALLAGVMVLTWQNPAPAAACSCAVSNVKEQAEVVDIVAEGTVTSADRVLQGSSTDPVLYQFTPTKVWKGEVTGPLEFTSAADSASCGIEAVEPGTTIMLFARRDGSTWSTNLCDGTGAVTEEKVAELTTLLGEPTAVPAPTQTSSEPPPADSTTVTNPAPPTTGDAGDNTLLMLTIVGGVALLGIVATLVVRRGRRTP